MEKLTLRKRKLVAIGASLGFIVPKAYIENMDINQQTEYDLDITKSKTEVNNNESGAIRKEEPDKQDNQQPETERLAEHQETKTEA